jgi:hypothetical protein
MGPCLLAVVATLEILHIVRRVTTLSHANIWSMRLRKKVAAWDDEFLVSLISK